MHDARGTWRACGRSSTRCRPPGRPPRTRVQQPRGGPRERAAPKPWPLPVAPRRTGTRQRDGRSIADRARRAGDSGPGVRRSTAAVGSIAWFAIAAGLGAVWMPWLITGWRVEYASSIGRVAQAFGVALIV